MTTNVDQPIPPLGLRIGEIVEVRNAEEILATLDERGELDSLPFMPEMLEFCGRRLRVRARAIKLCDTVNGAGFHKMEHAVHLDLVDRTPRPWPGADGRANSGDGFGETEGSRSVADGIRCSGQAHGGCQAACLLYWKEAWLRRVGDDLPRTTGATGAADRAEPARLTESALVTAARVDGPNAPGGEERWSCQATELPRAAPVPVPWWDGRQYVRDVRVGNASAGQMLRGLVIMLFNKFQAANRKFLPGRPLIHGAKSYPFIDGTLTKTPKETLDLKPGERVRVKSAEKIYATLDTKDCNRGLRFDTEMLRYCGQESTVRARVEQIVDEKTGRMLTFGSDTIILDGVTCRADYNQQCPRAIYPYWREIWLERAS